MRLCFLIALAAALAAQASPRLQVAATLPPYQGILEELGGERVQSLSLVPPGSDPHSWEPGPSTLKAFSSAQLYFSDGSGMDKPWMPRFRSANSRIHIVDLSQGVEWLKGEEHEEGHGHHGEEEHGSLDPHLWTSPQRVIPLATRMAAALMAYDTAGTDYYKQRLAAFLTRAHQLDASLKRTVSALPPAKRQFIVFHPSYGYLALDYGLTQLSVEVEGKEPKPADLSRLVRTAKEHQVRTVLVQPEFNQRSAETLAREIQGTVRPTNPLSSHWAQNIQDFIDALSQP